MENKINYVICTECEYQFKIEKPEIGEIITCYECGLNLKIIAIDNDSVKVELTDTEEEDWGE